LNMFYGFIIYGFKKIYIDKVMKDNNTSQDTIGNLKAESGGQDTDGAREDISQIFYSEIYY
jgi:hypothetical protein